jgi:hypothetical protein
MLLWLGGAGLAACATAASQTEVSWPTAPASATASARATASATANGPSIFVQPSAAPSSSATASAPPAPAPDDDRAKLPEGFVRGPEEPGKSWTCGELTIESVMPTDQAIPYVRIFDATGKKIYEAHGRRMTGEGAMAANQWMTAGWCGDLTGDGIPEVFLAEWSMGAHCCHTYYLVSLTRPSKTLLMWEKGDGGFGMTPKKLKPGKAWQVVSYELIEPPFDANQGDPTIAGYAGIPSYPIIFDWDGQAYRKRTLSFTGALVQMRKEMREECAANRSCDDLVFFDWGYSLMIGDWPKQRAAITDEALRQVLDKRAPAMGNLLGQHLGR